MKRRINGRKSTRLNANEHFPKIIIEQPVGYKLVETSAELEQYPGSQVLYEPTESGLGGYNRSLIVRKNRSMPAQVFTISQGVINMYWEDESVNMGDEELTFGD